MAYAVTHVLGTIVLLDIFRHYVFGKERFPRYLLVVGGIAGLAPDFDIVITWFVRLFTGNAVDLHGTFSHSWLFALLFLMIGAVLHYYDNIKWARIFYVIAAGWALHVSLDCLYGGYRTFLWPLKINTLRFCPNWKLSNYAADIDAILLVLWLVHEEMHKRIRDYW